MLRVVALLAGVALLVWRVRAAGLDEILRGFSAVGVPGFAAVLACSLLRFVMRAAAWTVLLGGGARFGRALAATLAGDAAGQVTPLGLLVSEPTKVVYLGGEMGSSRSLSALTAENFFYTVSVAIYVVIGAAAMLEAFPVDDTVRMMGLTALGGMAVVLGGAGWMAWRQPTVLSTILARVPIAQARAAVDRVREFEISTYGSAGAESGRLLRVVALHAVFHALSFLEMWITLYFLTNGVSLPGAAFVLDAFGRVANIVFKMIPLQLGVHQMGSEAVAAAVGVGREIGLSSSLVRTARVLVWAVVGLALLGRRGWRR